MNRQYLKCAAEALAYNFIMFMCSVLFLSPRYESDDDPVMAGIVMGAYGKNDAHIIFENFTLGKILVRLQKILPNINIYTVFMYMMIFISFSIVVYLLLCYNNSLLNHIIVWLLLFGFGQQFYVSVQFTKTAAILTLAGVIWQCELIKKDNQNYFLNFFAALLMICGFMYRYKMFVLVCGVLFWYVLYTIISELKNKEFGRFWKHVTFYAITLCCCLGLYFYDINIYEKDAGWKEYQEYNLARSELLDYGFPDYESNQVLYEKLGISENDLKNYQMWDFADPDHFGTEVMKEIGDAKNESVTGTILLNRITKLFLPFVAGYNYILIPGICLLFWVLMGMQKWQIILPGIFTVVAEEIVMVYQGRFMVNRVDAAIFFTIAYLLVLVADEGKLVVNGVGKKVVYLMAFIGTVGLVSKLTYSRIEEYKIEPDLETQNKVNEEVIEQIAKDKKHLYLVSNNSAENQLDEIWSPVATGVYSNRYMLGGWLTQSPLTNDILDEYNIHNPYKDMVDREDVYLVDKETIDMKLEYIREHYDVQAEAYMMKSIGDYKIYQIKSKKIQLDSAEYIESQNLQCQCMALQMGEVTDLVGSIWYPDTNSYEQSVYLGVQNDDEKEEFYIVTQILNSDSEDLENGKYGGFYFTNADGVELRGKKVTMYVKTDDGNYKKTIEIE